MKRTILSLLILTSLALPGRVCSQPKEASKTADFDNSHLIAVVETGDRNAIGRLSSKLPKGFKLLGVRDEKEREQDKYWGILFVDYKEKKSETGWAFRNFATDDEIQVRLNPREKYFSTNWNEQISEKGRIAPGPSSKRWDMVGKLAIDKVPSLSLSINTSDLSILLTLINDTSPAVRRAAIEKIGEIKDPRAIEPLIETLKDKDNDSNVVLSAKDALLKITGTGNDFWRDITKWKEWWQENKSKYEK